MQDLTFSWYGLNYLLGFLLLLFFSRRLYKSFLDLLIKASYMGIFTIAGGRLGYVLMYEPSYYKNNLMEIFELYKGGMSYHGAVASIFLGAFALDRKNALNLLDNCIKAALICVPIGRVCNFFNGELYGRITNNEFISVVFSAVDTNLRYPSQLIEGFLEGGVVAVILYLLYKNKRLISPGFMCAYYAIFYSIMRFFAEFTREADSFLGYVWHNFTMGQVLSAVMLISSLGFLSVLKRGSRRKRRGRRSSSIAKKAVNTIINQSMKM